MITIFKFHYSSLIHIPRGLSRVCFIVLPRLFPWLSPFDAVPKEYIRKAVQDMKRRCEVAVQAKGWYFKE